MEKRWPFGKDGRPMAFQQILKRFRRKYNVEKLAAQIPLRLFLFDLIYLDGKSVIDLPLRDEEELCWRRSADPCPAGRSDPHPTVPARQRRSTARHWRPAMRG